MSEEKLAELKSRWMPVYLVLIVALALVAVHMLIMYVHTGDAAYANLAVLSAMGVYLAFTGLNRLRRIRVTRMRVVELLKCESCSYAEEKNVEPSDYVLKEKGMCPKCGGKLLVFGIYSIKESR